MNTTHAVGNYELLSMHEQEFVLNKTYFINSVLNLIVLTCNSLKLSNLHSGVKDI